MLFQFVWFVTVGVLFENYGKVYTTVCYCVYTFTGIMYVCFTYTYGKT